MNKTIIFAGIIIFFIVNWLIGTVNNLHDDVDVSHGFNEKALALEKSHTVTNSFGDEVLSLSTLSAKEKKDLWNGSSLKIEMLELFPHFIEMKAFVEEHLEDDSVFKEKLLSTIGNVEFEYIGGTMSGDKAKATISNF